MNRPLLRGPNAWTLAVAVPFALLACTEPAPTSGLTAERAATAHATHAATAAQTANLGPAIAALRQVTARFHDIQAAADAGWNTRITDCFVDPRLGGMGFHYGNPALIDGTVNALEPELLLYEPEKNGRLRFVAVEYIVPFTAWTASSPPRLYEQDFHRNEAFGLWVLHVWHFRENPRGMFMDWNPRVSCQYATP